MNAGAATGGHGYRQRNEKSNPAVTSKHSGRSAKWSNPRASHLVSRPNCHCGGIVLSSRCIGPKEQPITRLEGSRVRGGEGVCEAHHQGSGKLPFTRGVGQQ